MQVETEIAENKSGMDEHRSKKFSAIKSTFSFNMSAFKRSRQKKKLETQTSIEHQEDEGTFIHNPRKYNCHFLFLLLMNIEHDLLLLFM